jgi:hypothetical protein
MTPPDRHSNTAQRLATALLVFATLPAAGGPITDVVATADLTLTEIASAGPLSGLTFESTGGIDTQRDRTGNGDVHPDGEQLAFFDPLGLGVGYDLSLAASVAGEARDGAVAAEVLAFASLSAFNGSNDAVALTFLFDYLLAADVGAGDGRARGALAEATVTLVDDVGQEDIAAVATAALDNASWTDASDGQRVLSYVLLPNQALLIEIGANALGSATQVPLPSSVVLLAVGLLPFALRRLRRREAIGRWDGARARS